MGSVMYSKHKNTVFAFGFKCRTWVKYFFEFRMALVKIHNFIKFTPLIFLHACNIISRGPALWFRMIYLSFLTLLPIFLPSLLLLGVRNPPAVMNYDPIQVFSLPPHFSWGLCDRTIKAKLLRTRDLLKWRRTVIPCSAHSHKSHWVIKMFWLKKKRKNRSKFREVLYRPFRLIPPASANIYLGVCAKLQGFLLISYMFDRQ